jgi:CARDB
MNRTSAALLALLTLVASLALASGAGAQTKGAALPDLVVKKVSKPPATGVVGTKVKLVVKVQNAGDAKAGKSKLGLYLGKGKKHTKKDKRLKRLKVKPLAAGKGKKLKLRVTLPAKSQPGTYRLFTCADDTKKVKEAKERNCKGTRKISLVAKPVPLPPPAAAFTLSDGLDWGFVEDAEGDAPEPGDPITLALTAANGIPGQAGYTRSGVAAEGFRTGATTTLNFGSSEDDGQVTLQLPFAFPFGGVKEQTISVSTNGWVSFGSPAWDYWDDAQSGDYRGVQALVGEVDRGLMPYWADLNLAQPSAGSGSVKQVIALDGSWVAYQWDTNQYSSSIRRSFQLVLFPDGSFRFDYPGENAAGGNRSFVGYSLGTGTASADVINVEGNTVPSTSLQFTPNALPAAGPAAAGEVTAVLPKGSSFVSGDAGCSVITAPGQFNTGLVSCPVPALGVGEQASRSVTFAMPGDAPGESSPANFRLLGTYLSGGLKLTDGNEIDPLTRELPSTTIKIVNEFVGPGLEPGVPTKFASEIKSTSGGLDEPTATFQFKNATITAVQIEGEAIECGALGGTSVDCVLPSGTSGTQVDLTVVPSAPGAVEFNTTARALNAPEASLGIGVAP